MHYPRVLLTTYHHAYLKKAGGEFEIFSVSEKLKRRGLVADIYGPLSRSIENYDAVLHFSVHGGGLDLLQHLHEQGKPIALWPNLWLNQPSPSLIDLVNAHTRLADAVLFKSVAEQDMFAGQFDLPEAKTRRILTQADPDYLRAAPKGLFSQLYGVQDYAICLGIIEPVKNQLATIRALKSLGVHLVLVGAHRDTKYYQQCREEGAGHVTFIDALPARSEILRSALQDARFYIETSFEPPGLSAIEAGLSGCKLVLGESDWSREHFEDLGFYCNPAEVSSIEDAARRAESSLTGSSALVEHLMPHCAETSIDPLIATLQDISG